MPPRAAFIVVNYFSHARVRHMLESLLKQSSTAQILVTVVDNSCDDTEWAALNAALADLPRSFAILDLCQNSINSGYAGGNNVGYRRLANHQPDVIVVVNPDVIIEKIRLDALIKQVADEPDTLFGAPTITDEEVTSGLAALNVLTGKSSQLSSASDPRPSQLVYPSGHFLAVHAETWKRLGGLSEDFFLFGEEADMTLRMRTLFPDSRVKSLSDVQVAHERGLTSGATPVLQDKSLLTFEQATRSSIILFRKHKELAPKFSLVLAARLIFSAVTLVRVGPRPAKAILRGLISGLRWQRAENVD